MGILHNMLQLTSTSTLLASTALASGPWREYRETIDIKDFEDPWYDPENPYQETHAFPAGHSPYRAKQEHITQTMIHTTSNIGDPDSELGQTKVHISFPEKTGRYPWIELHHAFLGITPEGLYNELKREIVSLGFIVFYTEPFKSHDPEIVNNYDVWRQAHEYYMTVGPERVFNSSQNYGHLVELDPHRGGFLCHADGCDITKEFAIREPELANLWYFIDPVMDGFQNSDTPVQLNDNQIVLVGKTDHCKKCCCMEIMTEMFTIVSVE